MLVLILGEASALASALDASGLEVAASFPDFPGFFGGSGLGLSVFGGAVDAGADSDFFSASLGVAADVAAFASLELAAGAEVAAGGFATVVGIGIPKSSKYNSIRAHFSKN